MSYQLMNKDNAWDRLPKALTRHSNKDAVIKEIEATIKDAITFMQPLDAEQVEMLTHMIYKAYWWGTLDMMNAETSKQLSKLVNQ